MYEIERGKKAKKASASVNYSHESVSFRLDQPFGPCNPAAISQSQVPVNFGRSQTMHTTRSGFDRVLVREQPSPANWTILDSTAARCRRIGRSRREHTPPTAEPTHPTKVAGSGMSLNDDRRILPPPTPQDAKDEEMGADPSQECWSPGQRRDPEDMSAFEK